MAFLRISSMKKDYAERKSSDPQRIAVGRESLSIGSMRFFNSLEVALRSELQSRFEYPHSSGEDAN